MSTSVVIEDTKSTEKMSRSPSTSPARPVETIVYEECTSGLGIKIIGGYSEEEGNQYGIFVRRVLAGGLAANDGRLHEGDQILEVNGQKFGRGVTNERAVAILRSASASNQVKMVVARDDSAREEYLDILENQNAYSYSTTSERGSVTSSRASTPSLHNEKRSWVLHHGQMSPLSLSSSPPHLSRSNGKYHNDGHDDDDDDDNNEEEEEDSGTAQSSTGSETETDSATESEDDNDDDEDAPDVPYHSYPGPQQTLTKVPNTPNLTSQRSLQGQPVGASTPQASSGYLPGVQVGTSSMAGTHMLSHPHPHSVTSYDPSPVIAGSNHVTSPSQSAHGRHNGEMLRSKLSLDPHVRLKVEKLEVALKYLGLDPTPEQHYELRRRLLVDHTGSVSYGDFVRVARELFRFQLQECNMSPNSAMFASRDIQAFADPPAFKPDMSTVVADQDEMQAIKQERDELKIEVAKMKAQLREKEKACTAAEDELLRIRREAQGAIHENRDLRSKVHLAEEAQKAARNQEQDYEEVVRLLEHEVSSLRTQQSKQMESPAVQKRLAVLCCQLRKAEVGKKTYEVATEKLLHFAELVHETLTGTGDGVHVRSDSSRGELARGNKPPGYLGKHKRQSPQTLAQEARDTVKAVKNLIEVEPLPFGWEEAYTSDGMRYYINHVTQMTTWVHPVSNVQHLPAVEGGSPDSVKETRT